MLGLAALQEEDFRRLVRTGYRDPDALAVFMSLDRKLDDVDLSAGAARTLPCGRRRRRWAKLGVADAMVEPDPVDPLAFARRVAVAEVDAPVGGISFANVFQRPLHGFVLLVDAGLLPLTSKPDVERYRLI